MRRDLATVVWKEMRQMGREPGSRLRIVLAAMVPVLYFGIVGPWVAGGRWIDAPDVAFIAVLVPLVVVMLTAPDSFAGERERKTLKTLLSTRLSDHAILYGKLLFNVMLGWSMALVTLLLGLITYNLANWSGGVVLFDAWTGFTAIAISLLMSILTAGVGVLVSLRSNSVQEAQQLLAAVLLVLPTVAGPIFLLLAQKEDSWMREVLDSLDGRLVAIWGMAFLAIMGAIVLLVAERKFQRPRLLH